MKIYLQIREKTSSLMAALLVALLLCNPSFAQEGGKEETRSISLVKTAEVDKTIHELDDTRVLTESYTVQKGDRLWQILRQRDLLEKPNLGELLSVLKKLNRSLTNLDLIHPGEKLIIPLTIVPIQGARRLTHKGLETPIPLEELEKLDLESYTVKPGDSIVKVVRARYDIPQEHLYNEYLNMVKRLNPAIDDLNTIYPTQTIRLPIYSPQIVRAPIERKAPPKPIQKTQVKEEKSTPLGRQLKEVFAQMGEEWVQTGQHFIPLKRGGEVDLKAGSFPIINLSNGYRVVVDLYNDLPEKMSKLIESSWENYRVVHLVKDDDLRKALNKILGVCHYHKIYEPGEPFELGGDIPIRITADWIIQQSAGPGDEKGGIIVITLTDDLTPKTPRTIKDFLATLGIRTIDYPLEHETLARPPLNIEILNPGSDLAALVEMVLNLTGQRFSSKVEIPVFQGQKTDFNLIIAADFLLPIAGRDAIIDLTGLGPDILSLLQEHQFPVLSLAEEKDPAVVVSRTLDFVGIRSDAKPHSFLATNRNGLKNIKITVPGIIFRDHHGQSIFATHLKLPDQIVSFLSQKGYKILGLTLS